MSTLSGLFGTPARRMEKNVLDLLSPPSLTFNFDMPRMLAD